MGLYDRGTNDDVPYDHFVDCSNIDFSGDDIITRQGVSLSYNGYSPAFTQVVRIRFYKLLADTQDRSLVVGTVGGTGYLYEGASSLISSANIVDFNSVTMFDRAYITFHNRTRGNALTPANVKVYKASSIAIRDAAGLQTTGTVVAATSGTAGNVDAGTYRIAVAFETSSGFICKPNTGVFYTAPGSFKIDLSSIPTGPAGTTSRHILVSKVIFASSGNPNDYELFFLPSGGEIADNVTTTLTINYYSNDLISSADYLQDLLETIPAGLGLINYNGRLVTWGENGSESTVRASKSGDPESFSSVDGFLIINPSDLDEGVRNCFTQRGLLYICKRQKTYVTQDNGNEPSTWPVTLVDTATGCEVFGSAQVLNTGGPNNDVVLVADRSGLKLFSGAYLEKPLTWKIDDLWRRINFQYFNLTQVMVDPTLKKIYVNVALDAATRCTHLFVGDYNKGLDPENIRWAPWAFNPASFDGVGPDTIAISGIDGVNHFVNKFFFGGRDTAGAASQGIWVLGNDKNPLTSDNGSAILSYGKTALVSPDEIGDIHHFAAARFRVSGTGSLQLIVYGEDDANTTVLNSITLASSPAKEYGPVLMNMQEEKLSLKFLVGSVVDERFTLRRIVIAVKKLWQSRPL